MSNSRAAARSGIWAFTACRRPAWRRTARRRSPSPCANLSLPRRARKLSKSGRTAQYVWLAGHWRWQEGRYAWIAGRWELPPRGYREWEGPRWETRSGGYIFVEGHWR
ncbi:MAG: hypothetical protein EXS32_12385 [Opitutus sp.]|nr:hypothetical protein [Opitutus sp.]